LRISIIGGGPGGLYLGILVKKARPEWQVELFEQNRADDTFGFGVVFSDETLGEFLNRDPESYAMIADAFAYWDDIRIRYKGHDIRCGGNGFAGCARLKLLQILQARADAVGVETHYGVTIDPATIEQRFASSDVIVAADGTNSRIRDFHAAEFGPVINPTRNKFTWMGSTRPLSDFTYFFRETAHGIIVAHCYQYDRDHSTWVIETTPECWAGNGFDTMGENEAARALEQIFADDLGGHPLLVNRSLWRNFPRISCSRWSHGRIVLLGDAMATAHFSIGSGTKLAMESAIALAEALLEHERDVPAAFDAYRKDRATAIEVTQHNAAVSLAWFEHVARSWDMPPQQFAMMVMSRAKSITWDNLELRDPAFLAAVEDDFYRSYAAETGIDLSAERPTPMFTPLTLRGLTIPNRVVVAPMAQYLATDGVPDDWHLMHYGARAMGGAGLVYVEMTCTSPDARITLGCPGLWNEAQELAWKRIVEFARHNSGSKLAVQLGHAGRKASTQLGWEEADHPIADPSLNWPIVSASPLPWLPGESQEPAELDRAGMDRIVADFVAATRRADRAGFDLLELHAAHGYLVASFLSPLTNQRSDEYGGSIESRLRFPLELFTAMRAAWPQSKPMSVRLSASDWREGGLSEADLIVIARAFKEAGCDLISLSSGQTVPDQAPVYGRMYQVPFSETVRNEVGIRTLCVGAITEPGQVNTIIACRRADLVALGRVHLTDPNFAVRAAAWYATRAVSVPKPYQPGAAQLMRETAKTRLKQAELQQKAKSPRHQNAPVSAAGSARRQAQVPE
jgi:anthraniloyl-CoA monooxygenase